MRGVVDGHEHPPLLIILPGEGDEAVRGPVAVAGGSAGQELPLPLAGELLPQHGQQPRVERRQIGDDRLVGLGQEFLDAALRQQRKDGTFNEHGGSDSSYQAVSVVNMVVIWAYTPEPKGRERLADAIRRAIEWERGRILSTG
jgi:hypothetical protein